MNYLYRTRETNANIEKTVAKLYLYSIPFKMVTPLSFLGTITAGLGNRLPFLFLFIGLVLILSNRTISFRKNGSTELFKRFVVMNIIVDITSIIMATILYSEVGTIGGEHTFDATLHKIVFSIAFIIIVFYNRELFKCLKKEDIEDIFDKITTICIIISLWQLCVYRFGSVFTSVYDVVNSLFGAWTSNHILRTGRIAMFTTEPATAGGIFGILIMPHLFSKCLFGSIRNSDVIKIILSIFVLYFTKSTTAYVLVCISFIVFCFLLLRKGELHTITKVSVGIILGLGLFMMLFYVVNMNDMISSVDRIFDKLFNIDNQASASRKSLLYVDWEIFKKYPIAGVGNGNQGFFFRAFFPTQLRSSYYAMEDFKMSTNHLFDGGPLFPAFISGYGIIGLILLTGFILYSIRIVKNNKEVFGYLYYYYIIASISLIVYGFSSTLIGEYTVWFIVSLPMAVYYWRQDSFE